MGSKESKACSISYEDAVKRVTEIEFRRLKDSFKKVAGTNGTLITRNAFLQDVLWEGIPPYIADCLFIACGGSEKGIAFKDLFCSLVLFTFGKHEEKIKFLWNLYSDSSTHISQPHFIKILNLESKSMKNLVDTDKLVTQDSLQSLFRNSDRINFDTFKEWICEHQNTTVLSKWLLLDGTISLTSELETPTFYQNLAGVTHLEEQDIGDLEKFFWTLKESSSNSQLDMESLVSLISPPIPKEAIAGLFSAFDENCDGHVDFKELCCGVSAACRGPNAERFCFKVFDVDKDGSLCYAEVKDMINILIKVAKEGCTLSESEPITSDHVLYDITNFTQKSISDGKNESVSNSLDLTNFCLTQEDFMMWSVGSGWNIIQPFLDLIFEVCHIVFGLRPQCKHFEGKIVKGWLSREEKRGLEVGQFWYIISADWWRNWTQYTQNSSSISCPYCKIVSNGSKSLCAIEEATICDESLTTSNSQESMPTLLTATDSPSLGSGTSGISYGTENVFTPGPIDNTSLIASNTSKGITSLTGEGGTLRKDISLLPHRGFILVPFSLWKTLSQWHGGVVSLPRQVIQPPNSVDLEIELYPRNLKIFRHQSTTQNISSSTTFAGTYAGIVAAANYSSLSVASILQPPKRYLAFTAAFSRLATIKLIGEFLCKSLKLKQDDIRLWHISGGDNVLSYETCCLLEEENKSLEQLMIKENDQILLEVRNKDLTWPEELGALTFPSSMNQERKQTLSLEQSFQAPGTTGLQNLGNTCFMNSALQVLFNTQPLSQYFLKNMHLFELNTNNKFGTKGQLALRYAELLKEVWSGSARSIAPLKLRFCVTKHAMQFSGGGQHDSQELLEWLLDALHEDLNRVTDKPYTELKDSAGRADEVVASEAWAAHYARNQSVIIDLFYGQLKSKVSCLCCGRESVRFDPFSLLSLPLPVENYIYCQVLVMLLDGSIPVKYGLRLNSDSKYTDLKQKLSKLSNLKSALMLVCEVSDSQIKCILYDEQKIKLSAARDIYVYELPKIDKDNISGENSNISFQIEQGLKHMQRSQDKRHCNEEDRTSPAHFSQNYLAKKGSSGEYCESILVNSHELLSRNYRSSPKSFTASMNKPEIVYTSTHEDRNNISMPTSLGENSESTQTMTGTTLDNCIYSSLQREEFSNFTTTVQKGTCLFRSNANRNDDNKNCQLQVEQKFEPCFSSSAYHNHTGQMFLFGVHRKLTRQDSYFLSFHKRRPCLFGLPILIPCNENGTNKDLYCAVWMQVARLLSPLPPTPPDKANHATDCDDSLGYEFPFTLKLVANNGGICGICSWTKFCKGCEINCNDELFLHDAAFNINTISSSSSESKLYSTENSTDSEKNSLKQSNMPISNFLNGTVFIAIDWDTTALHLRYQSTCEQLWIEHESVEFSRIQQTEPIDLHHCLKAFTSEEALEEWYHCSHCNGKKPATKKLEIWKLPPILIIHLKRFNYVNEKWVKSRKKVDFPFSEFDPTPYLASVPQETLLRYHELKNGKIEQNNIFGKANNNSESLEKAVSGKEDNKTRFYDNDAKIVFKNSSNESDDQYIHENQAIVKFQNNDQSHNELIQKRKRLISISLAKTPVVDDELKDFHDHHLMKNDDKFDVKYQLYAVIGHSGMLNGGHYVSYTAHPNGSWYCYNDSSCRKIANWPNIDLSSAYLLFYERRGLDYKSYLPPIDGRTSIDSTAVATDDSENDFGKNCVIS